MAAAFAPLSTELLGAILDLVDSCSLLRLILCGNTVLNNKLYATVTRFVHTVAHTKPCAFWPKILSRFRALTHVSISRVPSSDHPNHAVLHEVDLLALPATLRKLELNFTNALLCLLETLPVTASSATFVPRLRPDLKPKFTHLESLTWSQNLGEWTRYWDFFEFVKDFCAWPLPLSCWPENIRHLPLKRITEISPAALSLSIAVSSTPPSSLPPSLTQLEMGYKERRFEVCCWLPETLQQLTLVMHESGDGFSYAPQQLSHLTRLTSLRFDPITCTSDLVKLLPASLTCVRFTSKVLETESLAHFPVGLTHLFIKFEVIHCTTTRMEVMGEEYSELVAKNLVDSFVPNMRDLISKLPRKLKAVSPNIFNLVKPSDWDVFPGEYCTLEDEGNSNATEIVVQAAHAPFLQYLPQNIKRVRVAQDVTPEMISALPRNLRCLRLWLWASKLHLSLSPGSAKEIEAVGLHNKAIFEALSRRTPNLTDLTLSVDYSFEFDHLSALSLPLRKLCLDAAYIPEERVSVAVKVQKRRAKNLFAPYCLCSLRSLVLSSHTLLLLRYALPRLLEICEQATKIHIDDSISNDVIALLPRNLRKLQARLQLIDSNTFRALPRTLKKLDIRTWRDEKVVPQWQWHDLFLLPPHITYVRIPVSKATFVNDSPSGKASNALCQNWTNILSGVSKVLYEDVKFRIEVPIGTTDFYLGEDLLKYDSMTVSFESLTNLERHARAHSEYQRRLIEQERLRGGGDCLPVPSARIKRKAQHEIETIF